MNLKKYLIRAMPGIFLISGIYISCDKVDTYDPYNDCKTCKTIVVPPNGDGQDTIIFPVTGNFIEVYGQREADYDYLNILTDENESYNIRLDQLPEKDSDLITVISKEASKIVATNENFSFDLTSPELYYDLVDLVFYWIFWQDDNTQSLVVEMNSDTWLRQPAIDRDFFFAVDYEIINDGTEIVIKYGDKYLYVINGIE